MIRRLREWWAKRGEVREGVFIVPHGRDAFLYRSGDRELIFQADILIGHPEGAQRELYPSTIHAWKPPHQEEVITAEEREQILRDVEQHFQKSKVRYVIYPTREPGSQAGEIPS